MLPDLSRAGAEPPKGSAGAVRALSARLLGLAGDPARDPDPALYLALRLAREHHPRLEQRYLERMQDTFRHPYGRWVPGGPPRAFGAAPVPHADAVSPQEPAGPRPLPGGRRAQHVRVGVPGSPEDR